MLGADHQATLKPSGKSWVLVAFAQVAHEQLRGDQTGDEETRDGLVLLGMVAVPDETTAVRSDPGLKMGSWERCKTWGPNEWKVWILGDQ